MSLGAQGYIHLYQRETESSSHRPPCTEEMPTAGRGEKKTPLIPHQDIKQMQTSEMQMRSQCVTWAKWLEGAYISSHRDEP